MSRLSQRVIVCSDTYNTLITMPYVVDTCVCTGWRVFISFMSCLTINKTTSGRVKITTSSKINDVVSGFYFISFPVLFNKDFRNTFSIVLRVSNIAVGCYYSL